MRALVFLTAVSAPAIAAAQTPSDVRVVNRSPIRRWYPHIESDVLMTAEPGTLLEVLDQERGWYWVIAPRDTHGTRHPGWIQIKDVEPVARAAFRAPGAPSRGQASTAAPGATPGRAGFSPSVTVTNVDAPPESRVVPAPAPPRRDYTFEDVHFTLNQSSIRPEDASILDGAADALKGDPLLRMNIEGYTCSIGKPAYNLLLGDRRAHAVKDYLIGKGVPEDRLRTKSFGEENPKYDNSSEETRKLNRRVALVPTVEP